MAINLEFEDTVTILLIAWIGDRCFCSCRDFVPSIYIIRDLAE